MLLSDDDEDDAKSTFTTRSGAGSASAAHNGDIDALLTVSVFLLASSFSLHLSVLFSYSV